MGNCCPLGTSYAVVKPPHEQNPDVVRVDSCVADNSDGSYKKKESTYIIPNVEPEPVVYDNEALDLRERTLHDKPPIQKNGPMVMQPVSEKDVDTLLTEPAKENHYDPISNAEVEKIDIDFGDPPDVDVKKPYSTTTVVFSASAVNSASSEPENQVQDLIPEDPHYSSIQETADKREEGARVESYFEPTYDDVADVHGRTGAAKTTEVKMDLRNIAVRAEEPARSRCNTSASSDSADHIYSDPDVSVFHQNTRDTHRSSTTPDDNYAAIGDGDIQLNLADEDEAEYYEGQALAMAKKGTADSVDEEKDLDDEKGSILVDTGVTSGVTDVYAKVDKFKKSHSQELPEIEFSLSRNSCLEEDRELSEMWMEIETLEENLCGTLVNDKVPDGVEEDREDFYFDFVNETIVDISKKNDAIWDKEAEEFGDYDNVSSWAVPYGEEDDKSIVQLDYNYRRAMGVLSKQTARDLLKPENRNEEDIMRLISEHREAQLDLYKYRMAERSRLDAKLKEKLANAMSNSKDDELETYVTVDFPPPPPPMFNDEDRSTDNGNGDSETEDVKERLGQLMSTYEQLETDDEPLINDKEVDSCDSSSGSDQNSINFEDQGQMEARSTLNRTLKDDVAANINRMSVKDFQNLMSLYREEKEGIKTLKIAERSKLDESLWTKLAQRKRIADQFVHSNGDDAGMTFATKTEDHVGLINAQTNTDASPTGTHSASVGTEKGSRSSMGVGVSVETTDAGTGMDGTLGNMSSAPVATYSQESEIEQLDTSLIEQIKRVKDHNNKDKMCELVKLHLDAVTKIRSDKENMMKAHGEKIIEKLRRRKQRKIEGSRKHDSEGNSSSSSSSCSSESSSDETDSEKVSSLIKTLDDRDDEFKKNLEDSKDDVVRKLEADGEDIDLDKLAAILEKHHKDQEELMRKRRLQRDELDLKLQEKLSKRKRKKEEKEQRDKGGHLEENDNQFYYELIKRRNNGEITDADIGRLIEEHLGNQDEEIRKIRQEAREKRRKKKQRERAVNSEMVKDLLDEEREQARQMKKMRIEEKVKTDNKLQEKLRMRKEDKVYNDTPDLPAPRVPRKEKSEYIQPTSGGNKPGTYENIEVIDN